MNSISEHWFMKILFRLIPPSIFLTQYFGTVIMILILVFVDCPWIITVLTVLMVFVGGIMSPFWYRTFFDRTFVGLGRPLSVQWSESDIHFRGVYFDIAVPVENILAYKVLGFRGNNTTFTLKLKVRKINGTVENMWLSTTMPKKKEFIDFLDRHQAIVQT